MTINPTTLTVTEGDATGIDYTVVLTSKPAGDVTIAISGHSGTDLSIASAGLSDDGKLTFTTANWATAQTVTVKAAEDDDGVADADVSLAHAISSDDDTDYDALADQTVTVSITENDVVGVTINPTTLTVAEGDDTGVSYTVVLTSKPAGDVIVAISGHSGTDLTLSGTALSNDGKLTFTTANWSTAQTVTVKAAEDDDGVADADVSLAHAISSDDDTDYDALADQTVTVSITENDVVGVTISPTTLTVAEGNATGVDYTVVLTSKPAGDVTIAISGHSGTDLTLSGTTLSNDNKLTFTTANWGTAQTVTVKAAEDDDGVADADVSLAHAISSTDDTDYNALADQTVKVSITENDVVGVTINPTTLTVAEGDDTGVSYTVVLTSKPAGDVTVAISGHSGTDLTLSGTTLSNDGKLTFSTANWGTAQTVTVKAAEDDDGVADADVSLAHAISSDDDSTYNALADQSVTVSITEDDAVGVTISPTTLTVAEGDATGLEYTVVLTSKPAGDVTVTISGHSGTDLSIASAGLSNDGKLTFTMANWSTAQTVTVKAAEDDDGVADADVSLAHAISSEDDTDYDALADQTVTVSITEDDTVGVTISPTKLTVTEGDATGVDYTVVLTSQPAGDVTVTISGHSGTDLTLSGTTLSNDNKLTFTTVNWATAQTVTVKAAEDDDGVTDADVSLAHDIVSDDDTTYDALADQTVTVSITENDLVGVTISPTTLTVAEGDATGVDYTVVLTSQPAGDVTVTISGHSGTDLSIASPGLSNDDKLTFTADNWATEQTVTVKAAEDDDGVADADVSLAHDIASADDAGYNALADQTVTVSITEDDEVGVTINPTTLTVTEGDATGVDYTVVLTSKPAGDVTVTISGHASTDLSITSAGLSNDGKLTFTTANWATAQTVTVKAAEDDDGVADADVSLAHAISSNDDTDYNALANQNVTVSITENDTVGVTINPTTLTVAEGDSTGVDYTVVLTSKPAGDVTVAISGHSGTDLTLSGTTLSNDNKLTFTTTNWGTAQTVTVKAAHDDDGVADADVSLAHDISSADDTDYDALANQNVTVSITENDENEANGPTITVSFEKEVHYTIEGASGVAGVEVWLSGPLATEVTIPVTVLSQSTADPGDYTVDDIGGYASDPGLTFSPGETFGYVFVKAVLDTLDEQTETVVLGFGTLPEGVAEGSPNRSTVEISDAVQVSFADSTYMVQEGGPGVEVMVKLNKPGKNIEVPLTANGDGGADDKDFTGVPKELVFKDDETEMAFMVVAVADTEVENGEMVRLAFGALDEGIVAVYPDSAMVMIDDEAGPPTPRHFAASWPTQTSITLTWFTVETAAEYRLEYRKQGESEWSRVRGAFDHLPSTSDNRQAFGVVADLDCGTLYEFQVKARGSGDLRNDGNRYPPNLFGSDAITSVQTGECTQEKVTNLLVSIEPRCATLTWTSPSGDRDTGYRVERYSYTDNRSQRSEPQTLVEQANGVANQFQDCSDTYKAEGADHVYIVSALDDEGEEFGSAYTSLLRYGPSHEPEGPRNVRLTHDTQSSRGLAWDAPWDPWLSTVYTARAGFGHQQEVTDPWITGYRVERREYRMTEDVGWYLQGDWETLRDETDGDTATSFTDATDKGDKQYVYRVWAYNDLGLSRYSFRGDWAFNGGDPGGNPVEAPPPQFQESPQQDGDAAGSDSPPPSNTPPTGLPAISGTPRVGETLTASTSGISDSDGLDNVSFEYQWMAGGADIEAATGSSYELTDSEQGQTIQVRVTFTDDRDNQESLTSEATQAVEAAATNPLTGFTVVDTSSQPQKVLGTLSDGGTLTLDDPTNGSYGIRVNIEPGVEIGSVRLQLTGGRSVDQTENIAPYSLYGDEGEGDLHGQALPVGSYTLTATAYSEGGLSGNQLGELAVSFTVEAAPNRAPTGLPGITGTPQVEQTLTADTSPIDDADGLTNVSYVYQWLADRSEISGATGSSYLLTSRELGKTIQVRVTFTDDRNNEETLTSAASGPVAAKPGPLTASLSQVPASHDGTSEFTFELTFSEEVRLSYVTLEDDDVFSITGGEVTGARRVTQGSNIGWIITVAPDSAAAVTVVLPITTNCDADGAICTKDDSRRMLSQSLTLTVPGPGQ